MAEQRYQAVLAVLDKVICFTSFQNIRSWAVMQLLGMTHDPTDDFEHPRVPPGHRLRQHVLYRISQQQWTARRAEAALGDG